MDVGGGTTSPVGRKSRCAEDKPSRLRIIRTGFEPRRTDGISYQFRRVQCACSTQYANSRPPIITPEHFAPIWPILDSVYQSCFNGVLIHVGSLLIVLFIAANAVMKRPSLPAQFRVPQDACNSAFPNCYPVVEGQWLFSGLSEEVYVIGHNYIRTDDPVYVSEPRRMKSCMDFGIC
jgi:hypothetical protein